MPNRLTELPSAKIASRMQAIAPFYVMEIQRRALELEAAGRHIIHMEIGQPDFGAPPAVRDAVIDAMHRQPLGYTDALGMRSLREAIARFYANRFGVTIAPERIIVTAGASGAFLLLAGVLFERGDEVLLPAPGYPCNRHFVAMFDATPVDLNVDASTQFQPTVRAVEAAWGSATRGIVIASPSNPTGTSMPFDELAAVAELVAQRSGALIVDEIYQSLSYGRQERTILEATDTVFVVNSFSKYFNLTGWRIGWIVAPPSYVPEIERLAQNAFICPPAPAQYAALAALKPDSIKIYEERHAEFRARRDFVVPALEHIGFGVPAVPDGAFYIYADCSRFAADSFAFAFDSLERAGVAFTPGKDFRGTAAHRFVRFAYTQSMPSLVEGMDRLSRLLNAV
ncbi:MAG: pyridoxal phosphate-dependent aminotransferase [Betaproteobacteria bacterium]|nr:pyridoxal phosphate-dependent aminotransferase [Betaproteobacteria bacterium]